MFFLKIKGHFPVLPSLGQPSSSVWQRAHLPSDAEESAPQAREYFKETLWNPFLGQGAEPGGIIFHSSLKLQDLPD